MERAVEEAIIRAKSVYEMVTGQPAPEISPNTPYARIPPEVDREEHVLRQAASLFARVQEISEGKGASVGLGKDVAVQTAQPAARELGLGVWREGNELRFVFDVGNSPRERISVELQGVALRVSVDSSAEDNKEQRNNQDSRFTQVAYLPARVDPSAVKAEFKDSSLTVRVRMPVIDDVTHKIEIR
jgi:HSP20 family molecular chaperone IbpA